MSRRRRLPGTVPRFVQIWHWELDCAAYRHLSVYGRALLIEFRKKYDGSNNGKIAMSVRDAAKLLKCSKDTAAQAIKELEEKGWIRLAQKGSFSCKQKLASEWRITNQPIGAGVDTPETKEYTRWKPPAEI